MERQVWGWVLGRTGITLVGVGLQVALGELEVGLRSDLVEGGLAATDVLAGFAVARNHN